MSRILFPVLMQILNNFLKKQRKVSMGCRSIPLKFKWNCSKAPVVLVSSPYFSVWTEWENDWVCPKLQSSKNKTKQNCILCGADLRSLKNKQKRHEFWAQWTEVLAWNTKHSGSKLCSITYVQWNSPTYKNTIGVGLKCPSSDTSSSRWLSYTALPWISVLLPVALSNAFRRDTLLSFQFWDMLNIWVNLRRDKTQKNPHPFMFCLFLISTTEIFIWF